tara:strand:+ start:10150 stop:10989 length:840 start_codon:yes stop_codon:yes gene_type:complete
MVSASQNVTRGHADVTIEDLASALDVSDPQVEAVLTAMEGRVVEDGKLTGWDNRQVKREDGGGVLGGALSAAERKRAQRERERLNRENASSHQGHEVSRKVTTDKEEDKEENKNSKTPTSGSDEPDPRPKKKYKYSADDMTAAEYMLKSLLKVIPDYKKPKTLEPWANTVRLMREQDGRTHKDICAVWSWCRADNFENSNVQSADKLRTRFDNLKSKMGAAHATHQPNHSGGRQSAVHRIDQQCADEFALLANEEAGNRDVAAHEPTVWPPLVKPGGRG